LVGVVEEDVASGTSLDRPGLAEAQGVIAAGAASASWSPSSTG
jgi:hypothetical protein